MVEQRSPKPRAEGSSPSAPAKNREASTMLASLFFVSAHKDSATRHGCALRSACRGGLQPGGLRPGPTEAAAETKFFCPCHKTGENTGFSPVFLFHVLHGYVVHFGSDSWFSHSPAPAALPSSTRNAPGFAFFGLFRVRFLFFYPFERAKFRNLFLCTLPHSVYRLKSLVIPVRREVSFLT